MAGDKVVFHTNQRALSDDINDLQAMSSRTLADFIGQLAAVRMIASTGGFDTQPQSVTMGLEIRAGGGNTVVVLPGILAQFSGSHPAVPEEFESLQRIGVSRANVALVVPVVASTYYLLEARVVDVATLTESRDIFNTTTEVFTPTSVQTRGERRLEFQLVAGSGGNLPPFSGGTWVPLHIFNTDAVGALPQIPITNGYQFDCRPDLKDLLNDDPLRQSPNVGHPDGVLYSQALSSSFHPSTAIATRQFGVNGSVMGRLGRHRFWFKALQDLDGLGGIMGGVTDSTTAIPGTRMEHFYLAPLQANMREVAPVFVRNNVAMTSKGILVRSTVAPQVAGRTNSAPIVWGAGALGAFEDVPAGRALHVATVYAVPGGLRWFGQDSGGRCSIHTASPDPTFEVINQSSITVFPATIDLDLRTIIPPNARTAKLSIIFSGTDATAWVGALSMIPRGALSSDVYPPALAEIGNDTGASSSCQIIEIPVQFGTVGSNEEGKRWTFNVIAVGTPTLSLRVSVVGWSF